MYSKRKRNWATLLFSWCCTWCLAVVPDCYLRYLSLFRDTFINILCVRLLSWSWSLWTRIFRRWVDPCNDVVADVKCLLLFSSATSKKVNEWTREWTAEPIEQRNDIVCTWSCHYFSVVFASLLKSREIETTWLLLYFVLARAIGLQFLVPLSSSKCSEGHEQRRAGDKWQFFVIN